MLASEFQTLYKVSTTTEVPAQQNQFRLDWETVDKIQQGSMEFTQN